MKCKRKKRLLPKCEDGLIPEEQTDNTYVETPKIYYSYKYQPTIKDLGGSPGKTITQEERNKRTRIERNIEDTKRVIEGILKTFGNAISLASLYYGGGWALNRILRGNKASVLGQTLGRYVLPANAIDNASDASLFIFDPSLSGAIDVGTGVILGRYKDFGRTSRLIGELVGQGANVYNLNAL